MARMAPKIRPITDLKRTSEISEYCHSVAEPVFITKNGYSDLVIMSVETYEREIMHRTAAESGYAAAGPRPPAAPLNNPAPARQLGTAAYDDDPISPRDGLRVLRIR